MPDLQVPELTLAEWLVPCVICEKPTHGFAVAGCSARREVWAIWPVPKPVIYRAIGRQESLGLSWR